MRIIAKDVGSAKLVNVTVRGEVDLTDRSLNASAYTHITGCRSTVSGRLQVGRSGYLFVPNNKTR